ncbi:MAG: phosphate signaling complex protein PhoU [Clostridia bacterium]
MRFIYEQQLKELNDSLIHMGALCETAISLSVKAFVEGDKTTSEKAAELEREINLQYSDIENLCFKLLLRQAPVASDFRTISAVLKMITDLERIGDQAFDISEIVKYSAATISSDIMKEMAVVTSKMVTNSIDAFVNRDHELAKKVIAKDDIVDSLFLSARSESIDMIRKAEDEASASSVADNLMIIKYLERIADHATNIAEWVVFEITGVHKDQN